MNEFLLAPMSAAFGLEQSATGRSRYCLEIPYPGWGRDQCQILIYVKRGFSKIAMGLRNADSENDYVVPA